VLDICSTGGLREPLSNNKTLLLKMRSGVQKGDLPGGIPTAPTQLPSPPLPFKKDNGVKEVKYSVKVKKKASFEKRHHCPELQPFHQSQKVLNEPGSVWEGMRCQVEVADHWALCMPFSIANYSRLTWQGKGGDHGQQESGRKMGKVGVKKGRPSQKPTVRFPPGF